MTAISTQDEIMEHVLMEDIPILQHEIQQAECQLAVTNV